MGSPAHSQPAAQDAPEPLALSLHGAEPAQGHHVAGLDFEQVYAEHFDFIWRAVRGLGIPAGSVDDVTQDVFIIVHRKLGSLESPGALRSWLFGIARRVCKDVRRAAGRRGTQLELDAQQAGGGGVDPQQDAENRQALLLVERYAAGLDEERRALFFLGLVEGLPIAEVASTLGLNANTTYSRVRAMRRELADLLGNAMPDSRGNDGTA